MADDFQAHGFRALFAHASGLCFCRLHFPQTSGGGVAERKCVMELGDFLVAQRILRSFSGVLWLLDLQSPRVNLEAVSVCIAKPELAFVLVV
jgi:hypothetical protein